MEVAEMKLELFRYIDNLGENKLSQIYKNFIQSTKANEADFWKNLNEWQKNDIEAGLADLKQGKKRNFDEVLSKY